MIEEGEVSSECGVGEVGDDLIVYFGDVGDCFFVDVGREWRSC